MLKSFYEGNYIQVYTLQIYVLVLSWWSVYDVHLWISYVIIIRLNFILTKYIYTYNIYINMINIEELKIMKTIHNKKYIMTIYTIIPINIYKIYKIITIYNISCTFYFILYIF